MFDLPEAYVWDFWIVDDAEQYHLFFLYASRALHNPDARHYRASIGHAVSRDLTNWTRVTDALVRSDAPACDDLATWTGSVIKGPDGLWYLFYTGATSAPGGSNVQSITCATSPDLYEWTKVGRPILSADPRWYERLADGQWHDEAFRDPWVLVDPNGNGYHLLITARANHGPSDDRGVIGHGWSPDLLEWQLCAPLSEPGQGFGQMEVPETVVLDGRHFLVFNCTAPDLSAANRASGTRGGVWIAAAESPLGPYDIAGAQLLTDEAYVGRVVTARDGRPMFLAFRNDDPTGEFVGGITDPRPIGLDETGRVVILDGIPGRLDG